MKSDKTLDSSHPIDWLSYFRENNALWELNAGDKLHVKTSMSGDHVDAYFNSDIIMSQPECVESIIRSVVVPNLDETDYPDWVFSYAPYGLFFAYACAQAIGSKCGYVTLDPLSTGFAVKPGDKIIVVGDDIYSGGGLKKTIMCLEKLGTVVSPTIFALANLSGSTDLDGRPIVLAVNIPAKRYQPDNCELCEKGSTAIVPRKNWRKLVK